MNPTLTLTPGLDLTASLQSVSDTGAAFIEHALNAAFRHELIAEVSAQPFEPMPSEEGRARQEGEVFHMRDDFSTCPRLAQLRADLIQLAHAQGNAIPGVSTWEPNEVHVQRYHAHALGITPHLDLKRYRILIAILTITGSASFALCKDRSGASLKKWNTTPGSLLLLRAPGLANNDDGRPLHTVSGPPTGSRISVTWRMNSQPT